MAKITTKITSFTDVQKSLQEIEKVLNELTQSVNSSAETEVSDKDGKTGDIKTQRNADGTYSFEVKTDEGWKVPALGNSLIKFKDKLNTIRQTTPKSIEELDESDASTGDSTANLTTFDEKNNKFILPRADYDSGWTAVGTTALTHNLGTIQFSMCQISHNDTANNTSHQVNNLNIGTVTTNGENAITVAFPGTQLNYYRVRLWK